MFTNRQGSAFSLIELLVVVAIVSTLIAILLPSLAAARAQSKGIKCLSNLRSLGQGLTLYTTEYRDALVPGRMPQLDDCNWHASLQGRRKFRPNFLAMTTARTVAVADRIGTAASFPEAERQEYENNARDAFRLGNERFNLDPPRVDPVDREMAGFDDSPQHRSAADPRHTNQQANVLFVDGHCDGLNLPTLGYRFAPDGTVALDGDNTLWTGNATDTAWTPQFRP
jgi:prepilin-type processing-associated H-X9-DG protein/prepilin-type N-terminal cleavage/methylation domain-containing protein